MTDVIFQGRVETDGSTKIFCTTAKLTIKEIIISNVSSDYTVVVNRFMTDPGIHLIRLYKFDLDNGDTVFDEMGYVLTEDNYIQIVSDVVNTEYYIRAIEE